MGLRSADIRLRTGRPAELDIASAIDEDAGLLYASHDIHFELSADHPFALAERDCWYRAAAEGLLHFALADGGRPVGFSVCGQLDGEPYLHQLSVRRAHMRRGFGTALLEQAIRWAGARALWLTTYAHVPWNRPYYERAGFIVVDEAECGPQMRDVLETQRQVLPHPGERIAMRRRRP